VRPLLGWLAAASLLLHGWLPILVQVSLVGDAIPPSEHAHHAGAADAPGPVPSGEGPECPLFHGAICLCATFAKLLSPAGGPAPGALRKATGKRDRVPDRRRARPRRALPFEARAPPRSD
jgi:hypothetical protein